MKIQSLYLKNVRGLPSMDLNFVDPVSQQIRRRTVIAGSNGTGKTTILEVIGQMLSVLGPKILHENWLKIDLTVSQLTIAEFPVDGCETFNIGSLSNGPEQNIDAELANDSEKYREIDSVDEQLKKLNVMSAPLAADMANSHLALDIRERIEQALEEFGEFPTCIYFPSEKRQLHKKERGQLVAEPRPYQWVYRFSDSEEWKGSLESFLVDMYFTDVQTWFKSAKETNGKSTPSVGHGKFSEFIKIINGFLSGKQIQDVSEEKRVLIKTDNGLDLSFDQISSGEKQIILLLGEIQRRIQHGSIVMIDEPEIHLHPRWQRMLMRALTDLCEAYDAQLIITTQSEQIANSVYKHELILLDRIFESTLPADTEIAKAS